MECKESGCSEEANVRKMCNYHYNVWYNINKRDKTKRKQTLEKYHKSYKYKAVIRKYRDKTEVKRYRAYKESLRRSYVARATPAWADMAAIKEIYMNCPEGYHVDHIVPLRGKSVCGLHIETNLQYLRAEDNIKKNNKFEV